MVATLGQGCPDARLQRPTGIFQERGAVFHRRPVVLQGGLRRPVTGLAVASCGREQRIVCPAAFLRIPAILPLRDGDGNVHRQRLPVRRFRLSRHNGLHGWCGHFRRTVLRLLHLRGCQVSDGLAPFLRGRLPPHGHRYPQHQQHRCRYSRPPVHPATNRTDGQRRRRSGHIPLQRLPKAIAHLQLRMLQAVLEQVGYFTLVSHVPNML